MEGGDGMGGSYGGLGYTTGGATINDDGMEAEGVAGDMLRNLMQQCLAYHQGQQQQQKPPLEGTSTATTAAALAINQEQDGPEGVPLTTSIPPQEVPPPPNQQEKQPQDLAVQEGRSRATAILEKFQQLTQAHGVVAARTSTTTSSSDAEMAFHFRQKRQAALERELQLKKKFWIKNFDYVAERDKQRLHQQMHQLEQAKAWEHKVHDQYQVVLEQRKRRLLGGHQQAGIGTAKRKQVEQVKTKAGHRPQASQQQDYSVAIYLSGLPVDGSIAQDDTLHALFSSYGIIRKVHFYRHKQTGDLKGDALVIYQVDSNNKKQELVHSVCSQLNGAELPCGAILKVEPADSTYQQQQQQQQQQTNTYYGPQSTSSTTPTAQQDTRLANSQPAAKEEESDGDLDDFFESLE